MNNQEDALTNTTTLKVDLAIIGAGVAGVSAVAEAAKEGLSWCIFNTNPEMAALSSGVFDGSQIFHAQAALEPTGRDDATKASFESIDTMLHELEDPHTGLLGKTDTPATLLDTWGRIYRVTRAQKSQLRGDITSILQETQTNKQLTGPRIAIGGFGYHRASPDPASHFNQVFGCAGEPLFVDLPLPRKSDHPSPFYWARDIDEDPQGWLGPWQEAIASLQEQYPSLQLLLFPPLLGFTSPENICQTLSTATNIRCAELLATTLSIPGFRLHTALNKYLEQLKHDEQTTQILNGSPQMPVVTQSTEQLTAETPYRLFSCTYLPKHPVAGAPEAIIAKQWLLTTGGRSINALDAKADSPQEDFLGLPLFCPDIGKESQPSDATERLTGNDLIPVARIQRIPETMDRLLKAGIKFDEQWRPCDEFGGYLYSNVRAAGPIIATSQRMSLAQQQRQAIAATRAAIEDLRKDKVS